MADERRDGTAGRPDDLVARLTQAMSPESVADPTEAVEALQPMLASTEPGLAGRGLYLVGVTHMRAGRYEDAIEYLTRALDAGELNAAYTLGALLAQAGRYEDATRAMESAATLPDAALAATLFLARLAIARKDVEAAITATRKALRLAPAPSQTEPAATLTDSARPVGTEHRYSEPGDRYSEPGGSERSSTEQSGMPMAINPADWFQLAVALHEAGQDLISVECFEECARTAEGVLAATASGNAERLRAFLSGADSAARAADGNGIAFDALLKAVDSGSTSLGQALRKIEMLQGDVPSEAETQRWMTRAQQHVQAGRWLDGFAIAHIVNAAWTRSSAEWTRRYWAGQQFWSFASGALRVLPHPQLYSMAMTTAAEMIDLATSHSNDELRREALRERAQLHLSPYTALQPLQDTEISQRFWRESLPQLLGPQQAAALRAQYGDLPPIDRALELAEADLEAAANSPDPDLANLIETGLSDVLLWRMQHVPRAELPDLRARCEQHTRRALADVGLDKDPARAARLLNTLHSCGAEPDAAIVQSLLSPSLDEWCKRLQPTETASLVQQLANLLFATDPAQGLSLLCEAKPILDQAPESVRLSCWMKELLMIAALAGERYPFQESILPTVDLECDARLRGARMIAAVFALTALDRPRDARRMVERFESVAPVLAGLHADAIEYVRTVIAEKLFIDEIERDPVLSARQAASMLDFYTRHQLPDHASNVMYQLSLSARLPAAVPIVLDALQVRGLRTASFLGQRGNQQLIHINNQALVTLYPTPEAPETWLQLIQQIGGARFSAALASGVGYRVPPGSARAILNQIQMLAKEDLEANGSEAADKELLTTYVSSEAELEGDDAAERLANLRHRFDWLANLDLADRAAEHPADRLHADEILASVGSNTAVLHLVTLPKPDGSTIIIGTCLASGRVTIDGMESVFPETSGNGQSPLSALADHVLTVRRLVQEPADGPLPVSVQAAGVLRDDYDRLLPANCQRALREAHEAGHDHLVIVPHGPLHYYPLHLLGPTSSPLCNSWKVSYLPTLAALGPRRAPSIFDAGRSPIAAIGLGFEGRPEVSVTLRGAIDQAREIAALFGHTPVAEADATKSRVLHAMRTSRRVHLATHGHNSVTAPAFQSILVTPSAAGGDSEIAAWEIGELDLRGLEIVTTAACETGLGRFDELDNLRGLPASLFLAGVQAIATTLWPVGVDSSRTFFTTFYSKLKDGASRIDAFAAAQQAARSQSPEYRWWAAYTLSGSWT